MKTKIDEYKDAKQSKNDINRRPVTDECRLQNWLSIGILCQFFFIRRSTRDLVSVPAPLNAYTALQLCFDHGLILFR